MTETRTVPFRVYTEPFGEETVMVLVDREDDVPYLVVDRLESNWLFAGKIDHPDPGVEREAGTVTFTPDGKIVDVDLD